jgi:hypothetical protein
MAHTACIFQDYADVSIGVDNIAQFDDIRMVYSSEDCDFSVNLVHPRLGIHALLSNKFDGNLQLVHVKEITATKWE